MMISHDVLGMLTGIGAADYRLRAAYSQPLTYRPVWPHFQHLKQQIVAQLLSWQAFLPQ